MENQINIGDQNTQQIGQNTFNQPVSNSTINQIPHKPVWQADAFIILSLVVFWPLGLLLMWKYASWRKRVKLGLSIFFAFDWIILLVLAFVLLFSASLIDSLSDKRHEPPYNANTQLESRTKQVDSYTFKTAENGDIQIINANNGITFQIPQGLPYQVVPSTSGDKEGKPPPDKKLIVYSDEKRKLYNQPFVTLDIYPDPDGGIWTSHRDLRGAIPEIVGGLEAVKFINDTGGETLYVHKFSTVFWFELRTDSRHFDYFGKPLTDEEKIGNRKAFDLIKVTFQNTDQ